MTNHVVQKETQRDLRCGICRQKGIFYCEHDTPYRDQYLGTFDATTPRNINIVEGKSRYKNKRNNHPKSTDDHHQDKTANKPLNNNVATQPSKK
ncbi:unnamed protein product [Rotaria sordida]|uniref:Uncharacterized protein n=1 Tax=Rotaria sordida TaxID=392033 RepID=A0A815HSU1_9BILA|nr:unnamed protein product [Rotaria sordida]CAF4030722.1 unnamed protein product [Rotaria sordida]